MQQATPKGGSQEEAAAAAAEEGDAQEPQPQTQDAVQQQLQTMQEQLTQTEDKMKRALAETQNVRQRTEREIAAAHRSAVRRVCEALLPVMDELELALQAVPKKPKDKTTAPLVEGVDLTRRKFLDALGQFDVQRVDPSGSPFDPRQHEAISMVDAQDVAPNTVVEVLQKGYLLGEQVLRAARVVVAKPAPTPPSPPAQED